MLTSTLSSTNKVTLPNKSLSRWENSISVTYMSYFEEKKTYYGETFDAKHKPPYPLSLTSRKDTSPFVKKTVRGCNLGIFELIG